MNALKSFLAATLRHTEIGRAYRRRKDQRTLEAWEASGRMGSPPQSYKRRMLREYAQRFGLSCLVETGTFLGDTVADVREAFSEIYTIELSPELARQARRRFAREPHIHVVEGDAGVRLREILPKLSGPSLFWLDAHYSAGFTARAGQDTPIEQEVASIAELRPERKDVLLIDDARCFEGRDGYPTVAALRAFLEGAGYDSFELEHDIIRVRSSRLPDGKAG